MIIIVEVKALFIIINSDEINCQFLKMYIILFLLKKITSISMVNTCCKSIPKLEIMLSVMK